MGRPLFWDTATNEYLTLENGKPRPLSDDEFLRVTMPDNRQGVSNTERTIAISLTNDPAAAELYLEQQGYWVKRYGRGWNFAVQKKQEGVDKPDPHAWRVVDPRGGLDTIKDIVLDNAGALGAGVMAIAGQAGGAAAGAVGGAAVGNIPGGIIGGALGSLAGSGLGSAGGEFLRQKLGQSLGVPQEIDDDQIMAAGLIGAAVPIAGPIAGRLAMRGGRFGMAVVKKVASGAGEVALQLSARLAGLEKSGSLISGAEALLKRASTTAHFPQIVSLLKIMRQKVGATLSAQTPARKEIEQRLADTTETFDLRPFLKTLRQVPKKATEADKSAIRKNYLQVIQRLRTALDAPQPKITTASGEVLTAGAPRLQSAGTDILTGARDIDVRSAIPRSTATRVTTGMAGDPLMGQMPHDPIHDVVSRVPAVVVDEIRQLAGNMGKFNMTSATQGATSLSTGAAERGAGQLGGMLRQRLGPRFDELMETVGQQMRSANDLKSRIGKFTATGRSVGLKTGSENTLRNTFSQGASDFLDVVQRFDKWHGSEFEEPLRLAVIGERFSGPGGTPARTLRPTVSGGVKGTAVVQSATGITLKGGIPGALMRATGAFGMGTEAGVVGGTRFFRGIPVTPLGRVGSRIGQGLAATERGIGAAANAAGNVLATAPSRAAQVAALQASIRQRMMEESDLMEPTP